MKTGSKLCPLECTHGFTKIWPSDLFFFCGGGGGGVHRAWVFIRITKVFQNCLLRNSQKNNEIWIEWHDTDMVILKCESQIT